MSGKSAAEAIRVIVVDDQQVMREGLAALLGLLDGVEVIGTAGDGRQALGLLAGSRPDVVLMDLRMPGMDGVEATRKIAREYPDVAVLVLTTYDDEESVASALTAGARGYLTKDAGRAEIASALRSAAAGQSTFDAGVSRRLVEALARKSSGPREGGGNPDGLTAREAEVMRLISQGLSNREIASALFVAETTVKTHINNAFAKTGVRDRAQAVRYAYRKGLSADPPPRS